MLKGSWIGRQRTCTLLLTAVGAIFWAGALAFGAGDPNETGAPRSRVFKFRNITSRQAQDVLTQLKIGTDYNALTGDVLIVTGRGGTDLVYASQILELLDRKEPVEVRTLQAKTGTEPVLEPETLAAQLKTITVGTLLDGPPTTSAKPAIIDVLNGKLIAVAPKAVLDEIEAACNAHKQPQEAAMSKQASTEPSTQDLSVPSLQPIAGEPNEPDAKQRTYLEDLAGQLFGTAKDVNSISSPQPAEPEVLSEAPAAAAAPEPVQAEPNELKQAEETPESFIEDELLKTLADAERKAQQATEQNAVAQAPVEIVEKPALPAKLKQEPTDAAVAQAPVEIVEKPALPAKPKQEPADAAVAQAPAKTVEKSALPAEPKQEQAVQQSADANEPMTEDESMKLLQALLQQAQREEAAAQQAQQEQPEQPQETAAAKKPLGQESAAAAEDVKPAKPSETPEVSSAAAQTASQEPLKSEIDGLREQLARLERTLSQRASAPQAGAVPSAPSSPVQLDPALAGKDIDTVMDLPQEIDLENLIDLVGKQLGLNYIYDKAILQGQKVQLKVHGGKIKVGETYALLESVLRFKGFVMTRRDGFVMVLKDTDPKAEPSLREPDEPIPAGDIIVSTVFHLNHIDVNSAETMLKGMNLGKAFSKITETNTFIVTDYSYRMSQIRQVLEMIDVKGEMKEYKFRTLNYLKPSELVPRLKDLAGQLQGVNLQISTPSAAGPMRTVTTRDPQTGRTITQQVPVQVPGPGATATPTAVQGAAQPDSVYIDTDDRTNRVLIAGKVAQIKLVNELIDALDVAQYDLKYVREYIIQYVEAIEVVNVLNELGLASVTVSTPTTGTSQMMQSGRLSAAQMRAQMQQMQQAQPQPVAQPAASTANPAGAPEQPYVAIRQATNSLLVNATTEQHKAIELVIAHVDVIQKDQRTIRQYEIQHVDTQEIMDTLSNLGIVAPQQDMYDSSMGSGYGYDSRSGRSSMYGRNTQQQQMMMQQQAQMAEGGAPLALPTAEGGSAVDITAEQPQIAVLRATNALLVFATPRQHDAIALVIAHADRVPEVASTPYVVYALENQDPVELAEVLTKLIQETVEEQSQQSSPDSKIQTTTIKTSVIPTLEEEKIRIIPDEMSYSLIVYANKRNQQWVSDLIRQLDEYRPQVLLDCTLVEVKKDNEFKYNIDLVAKTYDGTTLQAGTPVETLGGDFAESGKTLGDAGTSGGTITAFLNTGSVQALLTAMQKNGFGRVMAQPKVLVNDNQEGEIKTENTTSIAQQKSILQPSSEQGQTITTTDVTFTEYTSGVTLKIKPHISKGDMLRLEITLNRKDFDFTKGTSVLVAGDVYPRPPDILSTDVTTVATVPDGTTIVMGGLESISQTKTQNKVPLLGDIPLLGTIFRGVDDLDKQNKLYIFVKANVIRPGDQIEGLKDIRRVSKKYRDEFETIEGKFQSQDDFPGWKPKPMDPETVLEEDDPVIDSAMQEQQ